MVFKFFIPFENRTHPLKFLLSTIMFAFQTDIDLETGIDLQSTTETAVETNETDDDQLNGGYNNDDHGAEEHDTPSTGKREDDGAEGNDSSLFIYQRAFNPNERAEGMYSLESQEDPDTLKDDSEATTVGNKDNDENESNEVNEDDDGEKENNENAAVHETNDDNEDDEANENDEANEDKNEKEELDVELLEVDQEDSDVRSIDKQEENENDLELQDQEADVVGASDENNNENEFDPELIDDEIANEEIKALTNDEVEDGADDEVIDCVLFYFSSI